MASIIALLGNLPKRGFVLPADSDADLKTLATGPVHLQLDALVSEAPDYQATPTISEVEDGADISDHVTLKPIKLIVQGIVTDTPVSLVREFTSAFQSPRPSVNAFNFLTKLWIEKIPFDFVGGLTVYKSMIITSLNPINNYETGDALKFTCTMQQVRRVSSQVIILVKKATQPKQSKGTQTLGPVNNSQNQTIHSSFQGVEPTAGTVGSIPPAGGATGIGNVALNPVKTVVGPFDFAMNGLVDRSIKGLVGGP